MRDIRKLQEAIDELRMIQYKTGHNLKLSDYREFADGKAEKAIDLIYEVIREEIKECQS